MKKILSLLLTVLISISIFGCNKEETPQGEKTQSPPPPPSSSPNNSEKFTTNDKEFFIPDDINVLLAEYKLVSDYKELIKPISCSWEYEGEATGITYLSLVSEKGMVTLSVASENGTIGGLKDGESENVPDDAMNLEGHINNIYWLDKEFPIKTPRGVTIGADKNEVVAAYMNKGEGDTFYTIKDINSQADESWIHYRDIFIGGGYKNEGDMIEYGWCDLSEKDIWRQYYLLYYHMFEDKVVEISFNIYKDAE